MENVLIFDTHPIQYRAPVFSALAKQLPKLHVCFFSDSFDGNRWWFHEVNKTPKQNWGRDMTEGYPFTILDTTKAPLWKKIWKLHRALQEYQPKAVLIYGYYLSEHWILRILCAGKGIRLVFIGETFENASSLLKKVLKAPLLKYFYSGVSQFVAIGERTKQFYLELKIPQKKIQQARYCVDNSFFLRSEIDRKIARNKIRSQLGISDTAFVILFVGRLFSRKRPFDVLSLHRRLYDQNQVHTVIVGNGELESELSHAAQGMERVHFIGFKNQNEIRDYYSAGDVLYVPSEYETWGLVVNEAALCHCPSMVTDHTGVSGDLVLPGITGWVVRVGDVAAAEAIVRNAVRVPGLTDTIGRNALERVTSLYRPEDFAAVIFESFAESNP